MANVKTVPNQKVVKVNKELCNSQNLYAAINIAAMETAAQMLDAGAFKLWVYFAKNQNGYEFALSSKAVQDTFGMKIKQYNNAIDELKEKGYLVEQGGNCYTFNEVAVMPKGNNEKESVMPKSNNAVMPKGNNTVMPKSNNSLLPKDIRNNTDIIYNTFNNTQGGVISPKGESNPLLDEPIEINGQKAKLMTSERAVLAFGASACLNKIATPYNDCFWINGHLIQLIQSN